MNLDDYIHKSETKLLKFSGYLEEFHRNIASGMGCEKAWQEVENKLEKTFGVNRYSSYDGLRKRLYRRRFEKRR